MSVGVAIIAIAGLRRVTNRRRSLAAEDVAAGAVDAIAVTIAIDVIGMAGQAFINRAVAVVVDAIAHFGAGGARQSRAGGTAAAIADDDAGAHARADADRARCAEVEAFIHLPIAVVVQ